MPLLFLFSPSTIDVLSFRFDKDNTQQDKKLDDMDLDDILNRAEDHETITSGDGGAAHCFECCREAPGGKFRAPFSGNRILVSPGTRSGMATSFRSGANYLE